MWLYVRAVLSHALMLALVAVFSVRMFVGGGALLQDYKCLILFMP